MGCSPSAYPSSHDRAKDPRAQRFDGPKESAKSSATRSSSSTSAGRDDLDSSCSSDHRRRRRNSLGKKSISRDRRGSFEQKGFSRQRNSDDNKDSKPRSNQDMKRKDTPALTSLSGNPSMKSSVSQLTSSQIDFFRMLDEKIAQGQDYESETDMAVQRSKANSVDLVYTSEARSQPVS